MQQKRTKEGKEPSTPGFKPHARLMKDCRKRELLRQHTCSVHIRNERGPRLRGSYPASWIPGKAKLRIQQNIQVYNIHTCNSYNF